MGYRDGGYRDGGYRDDNRGSGRNFGPMEKHKAVCADCKKDCEVPFLPRKDRPVYCRECYQKHKKF